MGDGDGRGGNGDKYVFVSISLMVLQPCRHFSLCLFDHAYHVAFQLVENFFIGCYCVIPRVYGKTSL